MNGESLQSSQNGLSRTLGIPARACRKPSLVGAAENVPPVRTCMKQLMVSRKAELMMRGHLVVRRVQLIGRLAHQSGHVRGHRP